MQTFFRTLGNLVADGHTIEFLPVVVEKLEARFLEVFQVPVGELRVFVRSDTNMEDLEDFTGFITTCCLIRGRKFSMPFRPAARS